MFVPSAGLGVQWAAGRTVIANHLAEGSLLNVKGEVVTGACVSRMTVYSSLFRVAHASCSCFVSVVICKLPSG